MSTEFSTKDLSEETKDIFVSNIDLSSLSDEPKKESVLCFDVNEQGLIAVGQKNIQRKEICVYTSHGEFLYGYTFRCAQSFCVEWDGQNINIFFVRSDVIISVDSNGNILDVKSVQEMIDNDYKNALLHSTKRIVGDTTYLIRNDMGIFNWFAPSFSQIVTIDIMGRESIIYDVNSMQLTRVIVKLSVACIFALAAVAAFTWQFIKLTKKKY